MADKLHFSLVSPERELYSGEVDQVDAPGTEGMFGVLPNHAPFMTTLRPGAVTIINGADRTRIFVRGGFADVTPQGLTILAETAIDLKDVKSNIRRLSLELMNGDESVQVRWVRVRVRDACGRSKLTVGYEHMI